MKREGQALLIAVMVLLLLLISIPAIIFMNQHATLHGVTSQKRLMGRTIAEEGVAFAIQQLTSQGSLVCTPALNFDGIHPFPSSQKGGYFTVLCTQGPVAGLLQTYQDQLIVKPGAALDTLGHLIPTPGSSISTIVSQRTVGAKLPTGLSAPAALDMAQAPPLGGHMGNSNAWDLLFTDSNGTSVLPYERESYSPSTGQLVAWVQVPSLSPTTDTSFYMYYGYAGVSSDQGAVNPTGVWDANYKAVWHMTDAGSGTSADSTLNNPGTNNNLSAGVGKVGTAGSFYNGSSYGFVSLGNSSTLDVSVNQGLTVSAWVKMNSGASYGTIVSLRDNNNPGWPVFDLSVGYNGGDNVVPGCFCPLMRYDYTFGSPPFTDVATTKNIADNTWHYVIAELDQAGNHFTAYVDGTEYPSATPGTGHMTTSTSPSFRAIGEEVNWVNYPFSTPDREYFNGSIDEVRISNTARSADWNHTDYNNQSSPSTFFSEGSEEQLPGIGPAAWYNSNWQYRKKITINHGQVASPGQTNFPVLISMTDPSLIPANGGVLEVELGPAVVRDNVATDIWTLAGVMDTQQRPRKFSAGGITGTSFVRSETTPAKTLSDQKEFWAYTSPGFDPVINLTNYQNQAIGDMTSCTVVPACSPGPSPCGITRTGCLFTVPAGQAAVFSGYSVPVNGVIYVEGNAMLQPSLILPTAGAFIVDGTTAFGGGTLTLGDGDAPPDNTSSPSIRIPPTAGLEDPYLTCGGASPCNGTTTRNLDFQGFLYTNGSLNIAPSASNPYWTLDGVVRTDGPMTVSANANVLLYYNDLVSHSIQTSNFELQVDSTTAIP